MLFLEPGCPVCESDPAVLKLIASWRSQGWGYKRVYQSLKAAGYQLGRDQIQRHAAHVARDVMSSIGDAEDRAEKVVDLDYFSIRGIDMPPDGMKFTAATIEERGPDGQKHWVRVRPETEDPEERIEIRQAQPIALPKVTGLTVFVPGAWQRWACIPDNQIGYWLDSKGVLHTTHDETCFSLGHQIMADVAGSEGLHGILDVGDFLDLSCFSRWNPTAIDNSVMALQESIDRASLELARRRSLVGPDGEVVILFGNHDVRIRTFLEKAAAVLVGLKRAGDPEEEWPVASVPYLVRANDYGVEWLESFPSSYRKLNGNLVAMHSPAIGSKPFDSAKRIASTIHASVVHGHSHRSERANFNLETTDKGVRTFSVWSSGTWGRLDGSLPSQKNSLDSYGNRILATQQSGMTGMLSENWHQGMDILNVEVGGKERWACEHIDFWGGWGSYRGKQYQAGCDVDGKSLAA